MARKFDFSCDRFLGLNYDREGEKRLSSGESPDMVNFSVTESYKLKKREGYTVLSRQGEGGRGVWCGELRGGERAIFVCADTVKEYYDGAVVDIGKLESTSGQVDFLRFSDTLYIFDGVKIKTWDTETFSDIEPYRPLVAVSTTPDGAGTAFEEKNLLTGKMRQTFTMNATLPTVHLAVKELDSLDYVKAGGKTISKASCSYDLERGTVTLPQEYNDYDVIDGIEIGFTKSDGREGDIHRMKHAVVFGGENDTRIFLWGDESEPYILRYSGVHDGVSGMEYFPENHFNKIGARSGIVSVLRHYDRLVILCHGEAFYSYMETTSSDGLDYEIFPVRPLSDTVGAYASALVDNFPVTLDRGTLYRWRSTAIRDERYAEDIGGRIKAGLKDWNFENAGLYDSEMDELYIWCGEDIFVYNYRLDVFYLWRGIAPVGFGRLDRDTLFQRADGSLCRLFGVRTDDGEAVRAEWSTSYLELADGVKNLYRIELETVPELDSVAELSWVSDHGQTGRCSFTSRLRRFSFDRIDFARLGFETSLAEKPLSMRVKHKRFEKLKLRLENSYPESSLHISGVRLSGIITDKKR